MLETILIFLSLTLIYVPLILAVLSFKSKKSVIVRTVLTCIGCLLDAYLLIEHVVTYINYVLQKWTEWLYIWETIIRYLIQYGSILAAYIITLVRDIKTLKSYRKAQKEETAIEEN